MEQKEVEDFTAHVKQLQEALQSLTGSAEKAGPTIEGELTKKFPNAAKPTIAALSGLGNAVTDVTAALYRGERGMSVMANGVDKLVDGLQAAAAIFTMFTPMGKALSLGSKLLINGVALAAKGVSSANKLNAEQSDKLYKVYQNLSDVGAAGAGGLEKLFDTMQQAGFTVAELDQFANAIKRNSKDLANFGATTAQGAENLAKMSGGIIKGDLGLALTNLGYTSESLANSTANYLALQNQLGRVQLKTATQLQKEATAYAIELDKLTRLTGLSREEQEKRQRSLMSDERYASFMATEAKRQGYDVDKLTSFFSLIDDESTRKGLQHMLAGGGVGNSEEAQRIMMTDPMAYERMMRVARGGSAVGEAQGFYGAAKQYMGGMGGELGRYTGAGPGISVSSNIEFAERMDQMGAAARKAEMSLEDFVKSEQGKAMLDKGRLADQNKLRLEQLGAAQALDSTVKQFTLLNSITSSLSTAFTNLTTKLGGKVAGGVPGATAPAPGAMQGLAGLREMIASKESGGNYNVMVGGQNADLTNMTIAQVMELQKKRVAGGQGSAAGKYQIINKTLEGLVKEGGIDTGAKFDQSMQDRLADMLIQKRGYGDYQSGKISKEKFAKNLSQEWAALPSGPENQSYYSGVGNNKAGYTWDQVMQNLNTSPAPGPSGAFGFNGTLSGPMSGYRPNLLMHGREEFSIKPNPGAPGSDGASATEGSIMEMISKISELVDISKSQLSTSQRILKYQQ